jgi:bacteriocin biosynthesis cyclodehydratase domain-containing protein
VDSRLRPKLALPFTVLRGDGVVRLVAGEDFRYTLAAPGLDAWLPDWLARFDGSEPLGRLLERLDDSRRADAAALVERLAGERVIVPAEAPDAYRRGAYTIEPAGLGSLRDAVARPANGVATANDERAAGPLVVFCQDRLDYHAALEFNRRLLDENRAWLWATTGPGGRGFVGPVFLPGAGPCLACVVRQFARLSPAPEIYEHLVEHAKSGGEVAPVPFPEDGVEILARLAAWKVALLARTEPAAAAFRFHVLEVADLTVSSYEPAADPECPECRRAT